LSFLFMRARVFLVLNFKSMVSLSNQQIKQTKQRLLWLVLVLVLGLTGGIWWYQNREPVALPTIAALGTIDVRFEELLGLVETLNRVTLDTSVLSDSRFLILERIPFSFEGVATSTGAIGRPNPFAPF
jgi:hypothetical protein